MKYISNKSTFPNQPHYAALVFGSITIPGDERSRTHPGHGYPESTQATVQYIKFDSKDEMEGWVRQQESREYGRPDEYKIIESFPKSIQTSVSVV